MEFDVTIEIPKGTRNEYEMDHRRGRIRLDRTLLTATRYPADYGFVDDTLGADGDPLDALVLVEEPTFPGCLIVTLSAMTVTGQPPSVGTRRNQAASTSAADLPPEIFQAALATLLAGRRLDMRALAGELYIGRSTLYRQAGSREQLLAKVLWRIVHTALGEASAATHQLSGADRIATLLGHYLRARQSHPALRRLLQAEPQTALRVLTSSPGEVQPCMIAFVDGVLAEEEAGETLRLPTDRASMAYVIVRLVENALYADVIGGHEPDVDTVVSVIDRLLRHR